MGLKKILGSIAPTIATALGGPLAGAAVSVVAEKLGLNTKDGAAGETPEEVIAHALESGDSTTWLKLKEAEQEFKLQLKQLDIDLEKVHQADRASARQRQMQLKDKAPSILAAFIMAVFLTVLVLQFLVVFKQIPIEPASLRVLDASLGILSAAVISVVSYYFGSSAGSKRKTELMGTKEQ
jgi:hypothetical protein